MKDLFTSSFKIFVVIVIAISVICRFISLEDKVYTSDEVRGMLRLSGYTSAEFVEEVYTGKPITVEQMKLYQYPTEERTLQDTLNALQGNPEHPPLYYLSARFIAQWMANPVGPRYLSALISILVFPAIFWLCWELWQSSIVGWVAMAILASSPFHLMLSQEARQYSLWTLLILLSSALLLKALKSRNNNIWVAYTTTLALGLYCHLFFLWVIFSHGIYMLLGVWLKFTHKLIPYIISNLVAVVSFTPWIWVILTSNEIVKEKTSWVSSYKAGFAERILYWLDQLRFVFVDIGDGLSWSNPFMYLIPILVGCSIYYLCGNSPMRVWCFILLLIGVNALTQVVPDLLLDGRRSLLPRYLTPCYLGIELAVIYFLASQLRKKYGQVLFTVVISLGIVSCILSVNNLGWWKGATANNLEIAPFINQTSAPLVIAHRSETFTLPLSYLLKNGTQLKLLSSEKLSEIKNQSLREITEGRENVFVYQPSQEVLQQLQDKASKEDYQVIVLVKDLPDFSDRTWLVKLEKRKTIR